MAHALRARTAGEPTIIGGHEHGLAGSGKNAVAERQLIIVPHFYHDDIRGHGRLDLVPCLACLGDGLGTTARAHLWNLKIVPKTYLCFRPIKGLLPLFPRCYRSAAS
jgi:hypothetical protein